MFTPTIADRICPGIPLNKNIPKFAARFSSKRQILADSALREIRKAHVA